MRYSYIFLSLIVLSLFSCTKTRIDNVPTSIEGTWKMILVKDVSGVGVTTKPSSITGDVMLTFVASSPTTGNFSGNTPTNVFTDFGTGINGYTLGPNQAISVPALSMTKVGETPWGNLFVNNFTNTRQYSFEAGGVLHLITTDKILIFEKQ